MRCVVLPCTLSWDWLLAGLPRHQAQKSLSYRSWSSRSRSCTRMALGKLLSPWLPQSTMDEVVSSLASACEGVASWDSSLTSTFRDGVQGREKEMFSRRTVYDLLFPRVVVYSKDYQTIQSFTVTSDSTEGYATLRFPSDRDRGRFTVHPISVDSVLQVAGFLANMQGGVRDVHICGAVDTVRILAEALDDDAEWSVLQECQLCRGRSGCCSVRVVVVKLGGEVEKWRMVWKLWFRRTVFNLGSSSLTRWFAGLHLSPWPLRARITLLRLHYPLHDHQSDEPKRQVSLHRISLLILSRSLSTTHPRLSGPLPQLAESIPPRLPPAPI